MRSHRNLAPIHDDSADDAPAVRPDLLCLFCQRCGHEFRCRFIVAECPPCWLAGRPFDFTLPATQGAPA